MPLAQGCRGLHSGPPPPVPLLTRQRDHGHLWGILGTPPLEPITPTRLPRGSRDARILWSNSSNPLLGPEQTFLDPPSRKWRLYLCPLVDTQTQCLGRLWRGFECIIWAVPTHVGQATHSSGWRWEWKRKEEWPDWEQGAGTTSFQSHALGQNSEDPRNSNLNLVFQVVLRIYLSR